MNDEKPHYTLIDADGTYSVSEQDIRQLDEAWPRYRPDGDPLDDLIEQTTGEEGDDA